MVARARARARAEADEDLLLGAPEQKRPSGIPAYGYSYSGTAVAAGGLRLVFVLDHCDGSGIVLGFNNWRARSGDDSRHLFISAG
jgi:hypothetical protein